MLMMHRRKIMGYLMDRAFELGALDLLFYAGADEEEPARRAGNRSLPP